MMNFSSILILLCIIFESGCGVEVILNCGLDGWDTDRLSYEYNSFAAYAKTGVITASSIMVYNIDENGQLDTFKTNTTDPYIDAESYQKSLQQFGLKTFPCIFCDATIGNCANLSDRLEQVYGRQQAFINSTIDKAKKYGWNGYSVDFEPDGQFIDSTKVTDFILDWGKQLQRENMILYVWVGSSTPYENERLFNTHINIKLITMDTYASSFEIFLPSADNFLIHAVGNANKIGFGLLTNYEATNNKCKYNNKNIYNNNKNIYNDETESREFDKNDFADVVEWTKSAKIHAFSIWATVIPPTWYKSLRYYLN